MKARFTSTTCPHCETIFDRLPVEYDEDGTGTAILETQPCADCSKLLCPCCQRFARDGCGQAYCAEHLVLVPDGTPQPLKCCASCARECDILEMPAPRPQSAGSKRSTVGVA